MHKQDWKDVSPLCCCEYWNRQEERSHILGCCCNCEDFDESCERSTETQMKMIDGRQTSMPKVALRTKLKEFMPQPSELTGPAYIIHVISCERIPFQRISNIMNTFQDRLRIPWRGGAKQISLDAVLPLVLQPLLAYIAAQNVWCSGLIGLSLLIALYYSYAVFLKLMPRTKFFLVWTLTSIVLLLLVFEFSVVPMLEILPEENYVFVGLVVASFICLYKVRTSAEMNHVVHADMPDDPKCTDYICSVCRRRVPPRTYHCRICQACVVKQDHHCVWLDCCVGEKNHRLFVLGLLFSVGALVYGAVLTLTTVCHPSFFFMEMILLPDDCSDVYHDFMIALCFVSALYCLLMSFLILLLLVRQCWLVSLGMTGQEWHSMHAPDYHNRWYAALRLERPYSQGFFYNWLHFCSCCRGRRDQSCRNTRNSKKESAKLLDEAVAAIEPV